MGEFIEIPEAGSREPQPHGPNGERRRDGRFTHGNTARMSHGFRRAVERHPGVLAALTESAANIERELGDLSLIKQSQVRDYVRLELLIEDGFAHLAGLAGDNHPLLVTGKGKSRPVVKELVRAILVKAQLAARLGLERRTKDARTLDPRDWLSQKGDPT